MKTDAENTGKYIPGTCNIGKEEIRIRRNGAIIGAILTVICIILFQWFDVNRGWRLLISIPIATSAISIQQWYLKFCVAFGLKGIFNFDELGKFVNITDKEQLKKDRAKSYRMIITGILIGLVAAIVYYLLPV